MTDDETAGEKKTRLCETCGAFGEMPHAWTDGDCILPHRTTNERHIPKATFGAICRHCIERHKTWLGEITDLYATLGRVIPAGSIPDNTAEHKRPKKAPASPSPFRLDAWALVHGPLNDRVTVFDANGLPTEQTEPAYLGGSLPDVPSLLAGWAQAAYDAQVWTATAPQTVTGAVAALTAAAEIIALEPWIDDYDAELAWIRRSLNNAHGITQPQPLGNCLNVGCSGKVWAKEDDNPRCGACGRRYGTLDLVRLKVHEKRESA